MTASAGFSDGTSLDELEPFSEDEEPLEQEANEDETSDADPSLMDEMVGEVLDKDQSDSDDKRGLSVDSSALEDASLESDTEPPIETGTRAQRRIQALAKEKRELQERMTQTNALYERQLQASLAQAKLESERQLSELKSQQAVLQKQLEMLSSSKEEDTSNLSPMEIYKRQILKEADARAKTSMKSELDGELNAVKQQLAEERQYREAFTKEQDQKQLFRKYNDLTTKAREEVLFTGAEPEFKRVWGGAADEMVLTYAAAFGIEPSAAAPRLKKFLDAYSQMDIARRTKNSGAKLKQTRQIPQSAGAGRRPASGIPMPSVETLRKAGYSNHVQWMRAGEPALKG